MNEPNPSSAAPALTRRSIRDELAFLLDSTVDLPEWVEGNRTSTAVPGYDRDTLLMRLEAAVLTRVQEAAASPERVREQAIADSPTWPWVLAFAHEMEAKLAENRHKGDREGWARSGAYDLLHRLRQEADELELRIDHGCQNGLPESTVIGEAAEVANFAMMIADAAGGLRALAAAGGAGET